MILFHNALLIQPKKIETKAGEMVIPESNSPSQVGIVEAIGSEVGDKLVVGDKVVYYLHSVTEIDVEGEKKYVVDFDDVIMKL